MWHRVRRSAAVLLGTRLLVLYVVVITPAKRAPASTIYDSGGFEQPRFATSANLRGQDAPPNGEGPWLKDSGVSTAVVQSAVLGGGLQAVQVSRIAHANGDTRWAVIKLVTPTEDADVVRIAFELRVDSSSGLLFGPAFGIECYDSSATTPKLIGSLTVDASTGDVLYQKSGSGVLTESGTVVPFGTFLRYSLEADFSSKTYTIFADDHPLLTEAFVDLSASQFTDAPLVTLAVTPDSAAKATGTAYIDDYSITIIPEPHTGVLISLGLFLMRRRTQQENRMHHRER